MNAKQKRYLDRYIEVVDKFYTDFYQEHASRFAEEDIIDPNTGEVIARKGEIITEEMEQHIQAVQ